MRAESSLIDVGDDSRAFVENPGDGGSQVAFDLQSGNPPTLSGLTSGSFHQTGRDVVSIPAIALDCVTRRQSFTLIVEQLADQRTGGGSAWLAIGPNRMGKQKFLGLAPDGTFDDRLMLARIARALVSDFTDVDGVA